LLPLWQHRQTGQFCLHRVNGKIFKNLQNNVDKLSNWIYNPNIEKIKTAPAKQSGARRS
jgi:hypothetical protein